MKDKEADEMDKEDIMDMKEKMEKTDPVLHKTLQELIDDNLVDPEKINNKDVLNKSLKELIAENVAAEQIARNISEAGTEHEKKHQVNAVLGALGLLTEGVVNTARIIAEVITEGEEDAPEPAKIDAEYETIWDMVRYIPNNNPIVYNLCFMVKWVILSAVIGVAVGAVGTGFSYALSYVTALRGSYPWLLYLLPFGGLAIVFLYRLGKNENDKGTNLVLMSIHQSDQLPPVMAPLIFIATAITHLFGGSSGREGAALQMGGCIGQNIGKAMKFNDSDVTIMTMCGMSAAFAALFGTPIAAAFLAMEIASVGVLYYGALVPCVFSALIAQNFAALLGVEADAFTIKIIPDFTLRTAAICSVLAVLSALVSILFCLVMHKSGALYKRLIKNPYLRIFAGGLIVIGLTKLSGGTLYNGAGMPVIEMAIEGSAPMFAFLLKILFTGATLGAGYKGGEIVPALFTGAAFGCTFAAAAGVSPAICAAVGMASLFCGITNCPVSSLLLCLELFGPEGMVYYLLAIALSYTFSGYFSVYGAQKIVYSKHRNKYINRKTI